VAITALIKIYTASPSVSLLTVFVTVTLSVVAESVLLLLLPRVSATSNKINTAAPTSHTQGEEYQFSVCVVVVMLLVELEEVPLLSCAQRIVCIKQIAIIANIAFNVNGFAKFFMLQILG
jgi:hypothetical protein